MKPGRYVALVAKLTGAPKEVEPAAVAPGDETGPPNSLPAVYNNKDESPFIIDVKAGDNDLILELKSRP